MTLFEACFTFYVEILQVERSLLCKEYLLINYYNQKGLLWRMFINSDNKIQGKEENRMSRTEGH